MTNKDHWEMLSIAAANLNKKSDLLGQSIQALELRLKALNLGVICWIYSNENDKALGEIGYSRNEKGWALAYRKGDEVWPLKDAPRAYKVKAVDSLPRLIEHLSKAACELTARVEKATTQLNSIIEELQ